MPSLYTNMLTAVLALVAVVGLVILFGRFVRSTAGVRARTGRRLAVSESLAIDRARSLRIVTCDGRELLLLVGGGSDVMLGWLPGQEAHR